MLLMLTKVVTVTRNGVRCNRIDYGQNDETIWKLTRKEVLLRVDPADASHVLVFDVKTRDFLTEARNERLRGRTQEDVAEGMRRQGRQNKLAKQALKALQNRHKDTVQHTIDAAAETVEAQRLAVGAETDLPVSRGYELLAGAAQMEEAARQIAANNQPRRPMPVFDEPERDQPRRPMPVFDELERDYDEPRSMPMFALDHRDDEPAADAEPESDQFADVIMEDRE